MKNKYKSYLKLINRSGGVNKSHQKPQPQSWQLQVTFFSLPWSRVNYYDNISDIFWYFSMVRAPLVSSFPPVFSDYMKKMKISKYSDCSYEIQVAQRQNNNVLQTKQIIEINSVEMCWFFMSWFRWILLKVR
jgi:hypothetical protein